MKTAFSLFYLVVHRRKKVLVRMLTIYQVLDTMLSFSRLFKWRHLEEQLWIGVSYWLKIIDSQFLRPGSWMKATFGISIGHKRNTNLSTSLMASFFCACQKPIALFLVCCFHSQGNCTGFPLLLCPPSSFSQVRNPVRSMFHLQSNYGNTNSLELRKLS